MRITKRIQILLTLVASFAAGLVSAQEKSEDEPFLPGLVATLTDDAGHTALRIDHQLAFHWLDRSPDPRLNNGPFQAIWRGVIHPDAKAEYRFYLFGTGEVELKLNGKAAIRRQLLAGSWCESAPLALESAYQPIEVSIRGTAKDARIVIYWSAPHFSREAIPPRFLFHPRERSVSGDFERGRLLARALRCGRCHGEPDSRRGPDLSRLAGNLSRDWLVQWLADNDKAHRTSDRRMPALGVTQTEAERIADWLLKKRSEQAPGQSRVSATKKLSTKPGQDAKAGEKLFLTLGCLACHSWRDLGSGGWFGSGDLTLVGDKRTPDYLRIWLTDPSTVNLDHRMPVFPLTEDERTALASFLAEQKSETPRAKSASETPADGPEQGRKLVEQFRCAACHSLPLEGGKPTTIEESRQGPRLDAKSNWDRSCAGIPRSTTQQPAYSIGKQDSQALRTFFSARLPEQPKQPGRPDGLMLLAENNCLACHAREGTREDIPLQSPLLSEKLLPLGKRYPDLATQTPAMTPPVLNTVGDKLTDTALHDSITRARVHRPYLNVRMPRFSLLPEEEQALVDYFVAADRVPANAGQQTNPGSDTSHQARDRYQLAGGRLISSSGFGCLSCHQLGSELPLEAPLNARGPDLSQIDRRIRSIWFDRWVRNPARIVPRMEMPSVQIPVAGVLDGKLNDQLAAVWQVLSTPGFEPPPAKPVRTLRQSGNDAGAQPLVITDALRVGKRTMIKPFLIGLSNRHNVLFDFEATSPVRWLVGDLAWQQTKGKTWYWELAGAPVMDTGLTEPDIELLHQGNNWSAVYQEQFRTEADSWHTDGNVIEVHYRLTFAGKAGSRPIDLTVHRLFGPIGFRKHVPGSGFRQKILVNGLPRETQVRLRVLSPTMAERTSLSADGFTIHLNDRFKSRITLAGPVGARPRGPAQEILLQADENGLAQAELHYLSEVPVDYFPVGAVPTPAGKPVLVEIAPGFIGMRLPLPSDIMPTAIAWRPTGQLVFTSLKGQVFEAIDTDGDGLEDQLVLLADGLPAPYGINTGPGYVDVSAKYAVLRIWDPDATGRRKIGTVASGWGYTQDYHDWAIGLPRNGKSEYFLGIPCQQDKRSKQEATYHGNVLKLVPREPSDKNPRRYSIEPISAGHRFPTGLAISHTGDLFVTDNQGNYNPFNELNHVRPGAHFGFINALDRNRPAPPLTPPAIDIPHPWTRSVNGICFLHTPKPADNPFEGHLIGCEYDTRRLIRMTLDKVGNTYQGACYPLSIPPLDPARGMLGPLACAVSPKGELYIGSIRDSGWGAGNNIGEIIRIHIDSDRLPCGIRKVTASKGGFEFEFLRPVDPTTAARLDSYQVQSYRRQSTPAYGGPDLDRRTERPISAAVSLDRRKVTLQFDKLREGFLYEFKLKNLSPDGAEFFPAEAYYTLRVIP